VSAVILALPGNEALAAALAAQLAIELGRTEQRRFPDGESYLRLDTDVAGRHVVIAATLRDPDARFLPLVFLAATARELGASRVGLVAPYLAYMRQDTRFRSGEAVTSRLFARLLAHEIDWLVTVDPHLHRYPSLTTIYPIETHVVAAAPAIAAWIRANVERPLVIGPDEESAQWVRAVALAAEAPHVVLRKVRRGDRDVEVSVPDVDRWRDRTPVLVDDIISTARTLVAAARHLSAAGLAPLVCIGAHAIFAGDAYEALLAAGAARVVTCNTIPHASNAIDIVPGIAEPVRIRLTGELADGGS
jgi:ribose-phosphate pyrophosphokinase